MRSELKSLSFDDKRFYQFFLLEIESIELTRTHFANFIVNVFFFFFSFQFG